MSILLGVNLGSSFAEFCLIDSTKPENILAFKRAYTPSISIADSLKIFMIQIQNHKPTKMIVASRMLEKILETKLGGSVAQIVTRGFENWPLLRQSLQKPYFELMPQRTEPLASQDLIFGINERINAQGIIQKELDIKELEFISAKLKMMHVERVCVNFLFANVNQAHQTMAEKYFTEQGFEVYCTKSLTAINDEIFTWRKNILNASLIGTFKEVRSGLIAGAADFISAENIYFVDSDSHIFQTDPNRISSSLFGPAHALAKFYQKHKQVLFLGMEKWFLLYPQQKQDTWQSPWGPLAGQVPVVKNFNIQPTSEIIVDDFHEFNFSDEALGYEPGPMSFGRAFRPTIFDLLQLKKPHEDFVGLINEAGLKKVKDNLIAMKKDALSSGESSIESITDSLFSYLIDQIGMQVSLEKIDDGTPVLCSGVFSSLLISALQKRWPEIKWELCPHSREVEGLAVTRLAAESKSL